MRSILFVLVIVVAFSCKNKEQAIKDTPKNDKSNETSAPSPDGNLVTSISLEKIWETDANLTTSEGVAFDKTRGVYYVSCIGNVPPNKEDGDGFIATLDQRGNILNKTFVSGLDAPKGMGISGDKLYVTDINDLVVVDIVSQKIESRIPVEGALFLNDVAISPDGVVYFTDSNANKIYKYENGAVALYLSDENLGNPNGILVDHETMYLSSFGVGDLNTVDLESKKITKRASGVVPGGDGLAPWQGGYIVSNWNGEVYYTTPTWKTDKILDTKDMKLNAADLTINQKSKELLIPTFFGNTVAAYKIVSK